MADQVRRVQKGKVQGESSQHNPESVDFDPYDFQLLVLKEITKIPARDFTSLLIPQVPHPSGSHQEDP